MLSQSLRLHLFCWQHIDSWTIFSFFGILTLCWTLDIIESFSSKEHGRSLGLVHWSQRKSNDKAQKTEENLSRVTQQLVTKLRPELWNPQPLRGSLPKYLLGPTVCWPLCYILGTWQQWLQRYFPIAACHQSELARLKKNSSYNDSAYLSIIIEAESLINLCWFNLRNLAIEIGKLHRGFLQTSTRT